MAFIPPVVPRRSCRLLIRAEWGKDGATTRRRNHRRSTEYILRTSAVGSGWLLLSHFMSHGYGMGEVVLTLRGPEADGDEVMN